MRLGRELVTMCVSSLTRSEQNNRCVEICEGLRVCAALCGSDDRNCGGGWDHVAVLITQLSHSHHTLIPTHKQTVHDACVSQARKSSIKDYVSQFSQALTNCFHNIVKENPWLCSLLHNVLDIKLIARMKMQKILSYVSISQNAQFTHGFMERMKLKTWLS